MTIKITFWGLVGGFLLGALSGVTRAYGHPVLSAIAQVYVAVIRGTTADEDGKQPGYRSPAQYWSLFGLFLVLAVGFGVGGYVYDFEGVGWPFGIVGLVMGAVAIWALINAFLLGRQPRP